MKAFYGAAFVDLELPIPWTGMWRLEDASVTHRIDALVYFAKRILVAKRYCI